MKSEEIMHWNEELRGAAPQEIIQWALGRSRERALVSTNFRPYEAVLLHLCITAQPDIPVLWVDHGYNRPATYRHAEKVRRMLHLNLKTYVPKLTAAHRDAIYGRVPGPDDEEGLRKFSALMKLEPFRRGMAELAPGVWFTALRKVQNPNRAGSSLVEYDARLRVLKVSPVFYLSDAEMEAYLSEHGLPNEWDYFDPAKAGEKRECGLHAGWGADAVASLIRA